MEFRIYTNTKDAYSDLKEMSTTELLAYIVASCKRELGIRQDFIPLGPSVALAAILLAAERIAQERSRS